MIMMPPRTDMFSNSANFAFSIRNNYPDPEGFLFEFTGEPDMVTHWAQNPNDAADALVRFAFMVHGYGDVKLLAPHRHMRETAFVEVLVSLVAWDEAPEDEDPAGALARAMASDPDHALKAFGIMALAFKESVLC